MEGIWAMSIVMGWDQHRAQITAEWINTATGEVSRGRIVPADRDVVRKFLSRFRGEELEVALEATTGWRFVVEELRAVGASVHLAEAAETSALRGPRQHAKNDRADARHLRELLMTGRLPECWIVPDHLLDLRARVRCRHTLIDDRGEWQQRMQAVLYHHGLPKRVGLLSDENRAWVAALALPAAAREQITVALEMIDALDTRVAPLDRELRAYARRQPGCRAPPTSDARPVTSPARARRRCAGRSTKQPNPRGDPAPRTATTTARHPPGWAATARCCRSCASSSSAAITPSASSATTRSRPPQRTPSQVRVTPHVTDVPRPAPDSSLPPRSRGRPHKTEWPQRLTEREQPPINHHVTGREPTPRPRTEISLGARAHTTNTANTAHHHKPGAETNPTEHLST